MSDKSFPEGSQAVWQGHQVVVQHAADHLRLVQGVGFSQTVDVSELQQCASFDFSPYVHKPTLTLPTDYEARKNLPIFTGVVMYFPLAMAAIAYCSLKGNQQHNPGEPLHWERSKSKEHRDTSLRHAIDAASGNKFDVDGVRHSAKAAWRALAALQTEIEEDGLGLFQEPAKVCACATTGCVRKDAHVRCDCRSVE